METEYCPQCVVELQKTDKSFNGSKNWLICPICHSRKKPDNNGVNSKFLDAIKVNNKNLNKFNTYRENET